MRVSNLPQAAEQVSGGTEAGMRTPPLSLPRAPPPRVVAHTLSLQSVACSAGLGSHFCPQDIESLGMFAPCALSHL